MRDSSEIWCTPEDINFTTVDERTRLYQPSHRTGEIKIYLSLDLFAALQKNLRADMGYISPNSGNSISKFYCSIGCFEIVPFQRYRNFLFIGDHIELERYIESGVPVEFLNERDREFIDREFEDLILTGRLSLS